MSDELLKRQRQALIKAAEDNEIPCVFKPYGTDSGKTIYGLMLPSGRLIQDVNVAVRGIVANGRHAREMMEKQVPDLTRPASEAPMPTWEQIRDRERADLEFLRAWWITENRPTKHRIDGISVTEEWIEHARAVGIPVTEFKPETALLRHVRQDTRPEDRKKGKPAGHN